MLMELWSYPLHTFTGELNADIGSIAGDQGGEGGLPHCLEPA